MVEETPVVVGNADFVEHKSFMQLEDCGNNLDEFLDLTLTLSQAEDESWMEHYSALTNLRVLNKYHIDFLQ